MYIYIYDKSREMMVQNGMISHSLLGPLRAT